MLLIASSIADEQWAKGPAHVNAYIEQLLEEHTPKAANTPEAPSRAPNTPARIQAALDGPFLTLSLTAFAVEAGRYTVTPFASDAVGEPAASPSGTRSVRRMRAAAAPMWVSCGRSRSTLGSCT
jgi:hypothetical protein